MGSKVEEERWRLEWVRGAGVRRSLESLWKRGWSSESRRLGGCGWGEGWRWGGVKRGLRLEVRGEGKGWRGRRERKDEKGLGGGEEQKEGGGEESRLAVATLAP